MASGESFLYRVAADLYARYGEGVSELHILFPNRRARLFFADALARIASRPMWQPHYTTIDELMEAIAGLAQGDRLRMVTELYKVYSGFHKESFDTFYFWGEMLLADFDAVDKYRIDAKMLFSNIFDLKSIEDDWRYLTPDQLAVVRRFWESFGQQSAFSQQKKEFLSIWRTLQPIYDGLRERLSAQQTGYNGMIQRRAADRIKSGEVPSEFTVRPRRYVVAGFNALTECEKILFTYLDRTFGTDFYWDYDRYYLEDERQEAGLFMRENIARFPPAAVFDSENFAAPKHIEIIDTVSEVVQCKCAGRLLERLRSERAAGAAGAAGAEARGGGLDKETAIVLTDENLLMPLLYSLPECVDNVNITMGYPLRQTLAYSFAERLLELQRRKKVRTSRSGEVRTVFYYSDAAGLLSHPYIGGACPGAEALLAELTRRQAAYVDSRRLAGDALLERIFTPCQGWRQLGGYLIEMLSAVASMPYAGEDRRERTEFLTVVADNLRRLVNSLEACGLGEEITDGVFSSLLRRVLQNVRIPFQGEPLAGVQVMGILETRNLDFENVVILSMNDDNFPGSRTVSSSFVPYNLRMAYGLPTPLHHEGVYAYYFYRLIQRARRVFMVYCSSSDEKSTGEPSRYIYQLLYESPHRGRIARRSVGVDVNLASAEPIAVPKSGEAGERLFAWLDNPERRLSPTALFNYVQCPLKFYFHSVARLRGEEEVGEEIDSPTFGNILHKAMETLYRRFVGMDDPRAAIGALRGDGAVAAAVCDAIRSEYLHDESADERDWGGNLLLIKDIATKYIDRCYLPWDASHEAFSVVDLEKNIGCGFDIVCGGERRTVYFGGKADRIDRMEDGSMRIVDYKSGADKIVFNGVSSLFDPCTANSAVLQTLLYAMMLDRGEGLSVTPTLYYARSINRRDYSPLLDDKSRGPVRSYADYREEFETQLRTLLEELFDAERPFVQAADSKPCQYCDFKAICRRE